MVKLTAYLAFGALAGVLLAGCGGSDQASAEACAKAACRDRIEAMLHYGVDARLLRAKWDIDCEARESHWYADRSAHEKKLRTEKAKFEFLKAHLDELKKYEVEVIGVSEAKEGNSVVGKIVELRVKGKDLKEKGNDEYELEDKVEKASVVCTEIEEKWKIKEFKGRIFR